MKQTRHQLFQRCLALRKKQTNKQKQAQNYQTSTHEKFLQVTLVTELC